MVRSFHLLSACVCTWHVLCPPRLQIASVTNQRAGLVSKTGKHILRSRAVGLIHLNLSQKRQKWM
uniref:Basonuclin zinc finger protein 2 n=1 Tax=Mus musculus TaxID=10090 RepID=H3BJD5_MOUSE